MSLAMFSHLPHTPLNAHTAHRDVKLDNIFQAYDGSLKLGDFGFATRYKKDEVLLNSCGTLSYAAPELLRPRGEVRCRPEAADVWSGANKLRHRPHIRLHRSAGVVLYALAAGKLPFHGDDDAALIAQIRSGYWSAPRVLSPTAATRSDYTPCRICPTLSATSSARCSPSSPRTDPLSPMCCAIRYAPPPTTTTTTYACHSGYAQRSRCVAPTRGLCRRH